MRPLSLSLLLALMACNHTGGVTVDADQDGYPPAQDCDDEDPEIHADATEVCDGIDNDCDGTVDEADAADATLWCGDGDGDGFGDPATLVSSCDPQEGLIADCTDCDDGDAAISPDATETWYDGVDQDCAGTSDFDADLDGADSGDYGGTDCDDGDAAISPDATETWYDGVDQDCAGGSDYDADQDGYEDLDFGGTDCRDNDPAVHPGATETWYDDIDADCSGTSDFDADLDGYESQAYGGPDCDDQDASVRPGATDTWYDGIDTDCAGDSDYDADQDGWDGAWYGGEDCADALPSVHPGAPDTWYDGVDADCAGDSDYDADGDGYDSADWGGADCDDTNPAVTDGDVDGDGWSVCDGDCDDTDGAIHPAAPETWYDGLDADCDPGNEYDADGDAHDSSRYGGDDCVDTNAAVYPGAAETWYDGVDADCAGDSDYDADADGFDSLRYGGTDCNDALATTWPGATDTWYDGVDADCAGNSDYDADGDGEDAVSWGADCDDTDPTVNDGDADRDGWSVCDGDCDDGDAAVSPGATEVENGLDDNCNGVVDDTALSWVVTTDDDFLLGGIDGNATVTLARDGEVGLNQVATGIGAGSNVADITYEASSMGVVMAGGRGYVLGGTTDYSTYMDDVTMGTLVDGDVTSRTTLTSLPEAVSAAAVATDGRCIVVATGNTSWDTYSENVYTARIQDDGTLASWATQPDFPSGRRGASGVVVRGYVYVIGGDTGSTSSYVYYGRLDPDCSIDSWTRTTSLPTSLSWAAVTSADDHIYVVGGESGYYESDDVYIATPNSDGSISSWTTGSTLPDAFLGMAAVATNGVLYATGGYDGSRTQDYIYQATIAADGTLGAWSRSSTNLVQDRVYHRLIAWDGWVYSVAGRTDYEDAYSRVTDIDSYPLGTSSTTWTYQAGYTWTFDFGSDTEIVSIDWSPYSLGDGQVELWYRVADSGSASAGSWVNGGTDGTVEVGTTHRYVQVWASITSATGDATSVEDITVWYR